MEKLILALRQIKDESGYHTVSEGQKTGFSKIYDIANRALKENEADTIESENAKLPGDIRRASWVPLPNGPRLTCAACGKVTDSLEPFCNECERKLD